ncbi:hypothetical protein [Haloechinothrix sp. LS1_15]|uniref:hypothetical protein n=1 Tax=Haloechinothrix sp. LS1_15 TaxID=2652248 RepID=UPI002944802F|nr:hypothetical protein [Haloechinothrix sp. LS1_15]MDV6011825.1 hypothetical protein [Haloechinothrix sp. LS1_15]
MRTANPLRLIAGLADWFEMRGVYVPGKDTAQVQPWREFGWLFIVWVLAVVLFILLFALAT